MTVSPADLLSWSRAISQSATEDEVQVRACISRAYYSALHSARICFEVGSRANIQSSHQALIDELVLRSKRPGQGRSQAAVLAKHLPKLKRLRVEADYHLTSDPTMFEARRAVQVAEDVAAACADALRLMAADPNDESESSSESKLEACLPSSPRV